MQEFGKVHPSQSRIYGLSFFTFCVQQEKQRSTFFSIFYLSINAGSLLSTIITPILRGMQKLITKLKLCERYHMWK